MCSSFPNLYSHHKVLETSHFVTSNLHIMRPNMRLVNAFFVLKKARITPNTYPPNPSKGSQVASVHAVDLSSCKGFSLQQGRIVYSFKIKSMAMEKNCWAYTFDEITCPKGKFCQTIVMDDRYITEFIPWNLSRPSRTD